MAKLRLAEMLREESQSVSLMPRFHFMMLMMPGPEAMSVRYILYDFFWLHEFIRSGIRAMHSVARQDLVAGEGESLVAAAIEVIHSIALFLNNASVMDCASVPFVAIIILALAVGESSPDSQGGGGQRKNCRKLSSFVKKHDVLHSPF